MNIGWIKKYRSRFFVVATVFLAVFVLSGCADNSTEANTKIQPKTFKGSSCTGDCLGHKAGYDWAEKRGITDPSDCGGNSKSFIEGCRSYAEEQ